MILGIDASNIRGGGGVTHLVELLRVAKPEQSGFEKVVVWGGSNTLDKIEQKPWRVKIQEPILDKSLFHRAFWQRFKLTKELTTEKCDLLFVPGGTYSGNFKPFVTMSQNLLPFEPEEIRRYGISKFAAKLLLLNFTQSRTFARANGTIFLTKYARDIVLKKVNLNEALTTIVNHGINSKFFFPPKNQKAITSYSPDNPFRILYVSFIGEYKHQWNVGEALIRLRDKGYPIVLDLVGNPDEANATKKLEACINKYDPEKKIVKHYSRVSYLEIAQKYRQADLFVFASSCETFGQILTEAMAAGLPIACSNMSAMPEILGEAGVYFDPLDAESIELALEKLINSESLRSELANLSFRKAQNFSWEKASNETFRFLEKSLH